MAIIEVQGGWFCNRHGGEACQCTPNDLVPEILRLRAELDAVRADYARLEEGMGRKVDVDAVLAPVRAVQADFAKRAEYSRDAAREAASNVRPAEAERHHGARAAHASAAFELHCALAEAEKIGRGE